MVLYLIPQGTEATPIRIEILTVTGKNISMNIRLAGHMTAIHIIKKETGIVPLPYYKCMTLDIEIKVHVCYPSG